MTQAPQWEHFSTKSMERWMLPRNSGSQPGTTCLSVAARHGLGAGAAGQDQEGVGLVDRFLVLPQDALDVELVAAGVDDLGEHHLLAELFELGLHLGHFRLAAGPRGGGALAAAEDDDLRVAFEVLEDLFEGLLLGDDQLDVPPFPGRVTTSSRSCRRAARSVLRASIMLVTAPTPPGTGVMAPALADTASKSTSPTVLFWASARSAPQFLQGFFLLRLRVPQLGADDHPVDAHVQHDGPFFDQVGADQMRHARGHDQDSRPPGCASPGCRGWT